MQSPVTLSITSTHMPAVVQAGASTSITPALHRAYVHAIILYTINGIASTPPVPPQREALLRRVLSVCAFPENVDPDSARVVLSSLRPHAPVLQGTLAHLAEGQQLGMPLQHARDLPSCAQGFYASGHLLPSFVGGSSWGVFMTSSSK